VSFPLVFTKALSLAPGLLVSAIRIKLVIPQSYLAGVTIITMPVLIWPLLTSCSIFLVQSIGDPFLWAAVNLSALTLLGYTFVGLHYKVNRPMTRNEVRNFTHVALNVTRMMWFVAGVCLAMYFLKLGLVLHNAMKSHEGISQYLMGKVQMYVLPFLMERLNMSWILQAFFDVVEPVGYLVFSFWTGMYMTAILGADCLLWASAEEWYLTHRGGKQTRDMQSNTIMGAVCEITGLKNASIGRSGSIHVASIRPAPAKEGAAFDGYSSGSSGGSAGNKDNGHCGF
jgi:hypothetical protein